MLTYAGIQRGGVGDMRRSEDKPFTQRQRLALAGVTHIVILYAVKIAYMRQPYRASDKLGAAIPYGVL